jgi:hypothetical protein
LSAAIPPPPAAEHLLALEGLRSVIQLLDHIAQRQSSTSPAAEASRTVPRDRR